MKKFSRQLRFILCATTTIGFGTAAFAQSAGTAPAELNLGNVVANDQTGAIGSTSPSATGTLKQAHKLQKLAPNVISVQPQSQIQKEPDVNLADALSRVPGVQLVSDSGEGEFINIRGLDADLNATTFDGIHLTANVQSTPSGGGRATDLSAFPAGIVGGVEVVKSLTPDMDAEGLGGSANLLPITLPADGEPMANVTIAAGQETLRNTGIFQGNIALGASFAVPGMRSFANAKPFSVILAYSGYGDRRGIDDVEEDYDPATITAGGNQADLDDLQLRYYQEHRVRQGFYGELDFDPSPTTGFFLRALQGGYGVDISKDRLEIQDLDADNPIGGTGTYAVSGAKPSARYTFQDERVQTNLVEFGGHSVIADTVNVDATASYEQGSDVLPYDYVSTFKGKKVDVTYSVNSAQYRTYSTTSGVNLADPSLYDLDSIANTPQRDFDQEFAAAGNASFATNLFGGSGVAKFGVDVKLRSEGATQSEYDSANTNTINLGDVSVGNPNLAYYNSHYELPPFPSYDVLLGQVPFTQAIATSLASYQHNSEDVYAGYGQETIEFGQLELLAGARVEDTNGSYHANLAATDVNGNTTYTPNTNKQDYINVFPSAQIKYEVSDQFQLRADYSTAIARPGFQQISAATTVDFSQSPTAVTIGNPNLKPTTGNSFDITAEFYAPHDGLLSGDVFYKTFANYIFQTQNQNGTYEGQPAQITSYQNENGAFARGVELDAQQRFYFLPDPLDGFGFDGNVTLVDSRGHSDGAGFRAYELPETSPISYNAAVYYDAGPFNFRVSANYVARSLFAAGTPTSTDPNPRDYDIFTAPRTTLDADFVFQATPRVAFFVQGRNLTNSPLEFTQSASDQYPIQREFYDADYLAGLRMKLGG